MPFFPRDAFVSSAHLGEKWIQSESILVPADAEFTHLDLSAENLCSYPCPKRNRIRSPRDPVWSFILLDVTSRLKEDVADGYLRALRPSMRLTWQVCITAYTDIWGQ
jgi:hypothetical protein